MGRSIVACIPFVINTNKWYDKDKYFANGFFDCYTETEKNVYHLKEDLFIANYKDFVLEFSDLIDEQMMLRHYMDGKGQHCETFIEADDPLLNQTTVDGFKELFDRDKRNGLMPYFEEGYGNMFSTLGGECKDKWLFHNAGGKAFLETYGLFNTVERIIGKSMKNPLAKAVKFGLYG
jgi:hypothetical protein